MNQPKPTRREAFAGAAALAAAAAGGVGYAAPAPKKSEAPAVPRDLAYKAGAVASAYGPGGSVYASFLCATPEKALALVDFLKTLGGDGPPDWNQPQTPEAP